MYRTLPDAGRGPPPLGVYIRKEWLGGEIAPLHTYEILVSLIQNHCPAMFLALNPAAALAFLATRWPEFVFLSNVNSVAASACSSRSYASVAGRLSGNIPTASIKSR